MEALPVADQPALMLGKTLVIADLHLGIEKELRDKGINVPSQAKGLEAGVKGFIRDKKSTRLIILGDVKHGVKFSNYEVKLALNLLAELSKHCEVHLVLGNHDGGIKYRVPERIILHPEGLKVGDFYLTHGHRKIDPTYGRIIVGHNHPSVSFTDEFGHKYREPCWLKGKASSVELILMPAFNPLLGNTVNAEGAELLGPLRDVFKLQELEVYLLDGSALGKVKDLMK